MKKINVVSAIEQCKRHDAVMSLVFSDGSNVPMAITHVVTQANSFKGISLPCVVW
jgi:hypothetical protein